MMEAKEACGVFGVYAPGRSGRPPHLRRPLRPPAPGPGVGRHGGERRRRHHRDEGHGPGHHRLRRAQAVRPAGPPGHRPHPLLDGRFQRLAQRPAGVPRRRAGRVRARPQRQPDQHRGVGRRRRACCPGLVSSDSDLVAELLAQAFPRLDRAHPVRTERRPGAGPDRSPARARGRLLLRAARRRPAHRRARPQRIPAAVPGSAGATDEFEQGGCWPRSRPPST